MNISEYFERAPSNGLRGPETGALQNWRLVFMALVVAVVAGVAQGKSITSSPTTSGSAHSSSAGFAEVDRLVLSVHPHGISYDQARRFGVSALPRLLSILSDVKYKMFWVNALVVIGFQENPVVVSRLIEFYSSTRNHSDVEMLRAHLAVPFALGAVAASSKDAEALNFLRENVGAMGKILGEGRSQNVGLAEAEFERMILGIAISGQPAGQAILDELKNQSWYSQLSNDSRSRTEAVLVQAGDIARRLTSEGRSAYFTYRDPSWSGERGSVDMLRGLPAPHDVSAKRHVMSSYSDVDLEADLAAATDRLFSKDDECEPNGSDVACPVSFRRSANVGVFGSVGDGLNFVDTSSKLQAVFAVTGARVKIVTDLAFCAGALNPSFAGCATTPGSTMVLEEGFVGTALFLHEYGHNRGLEHLDSCENNVMSSSFSTSISSDRVVNTVECSAFGGGGVTVNLALRFEGDGSGSVKIVPGGTVCSSDCSIEFLYATEVIVETYPSGDSIAKDCRQNCSFPMLTARSQQIRFLRKATVGGVVQSATSLLILDGDEVFENGFE